MCDEIIDEIWNFLNFVEATPRSYIKKSNQHIRNDSWLFDPEEENVQQCLHVKTRL